MHRRALDAHLRFAEREEHAGNSNTAVELLERAIDLDRFAEEPYRRLMALHARVSAAEPLTTRPSKSLAFPSCSRTLTPQVPGSRSAL
jgi:hypothetical protein